MRYATLRFLALAILLGAISSGSAMGQTTLDDAILAMSDQIANFLTAKERTSVAIGEFDGPDGTTAGRSIQQKLKENLVAKDIAVKKLGAKMKIRGSFFLQTESTFSIATIKSTMVDENGREMSGFRERVKLAQVTSLEDLSRIFGVTADLVAEKSGKTTAEGDAATKLVSINKAVARKVEDAISSPGFAYDNGSASRIKASDGSQFVVEMRRRSRGASSSAPVGIVDEGGFAFAPLEDGDVYEITVSNNADHDVSVKLSIDGVNSFHFSENTAFKDNGSWVIAAGKQGVIRGWYVNSGLLREFLVTSDEKDPNLPDPLDLGTVTVQFFHAWESGSPVPEIEQLAGVTRDQLRTTQGKLIGQTSGSVQRNFGTQLLASVSIRYSNPIDLPASEAP